MNHENNKVEEGVTEVKRSRRWLLKSSAGLTAIAIAAPMLGPSVAEATVPAATTTAAASFVAADYEDFDMVGGI